MVEKTRERRSHIRRFDVDSNLMYLIQNITGHSTNQILSYFYSMATSMTDHYLKKNKIARYINKQLKWHYEGYPSIPYNIQVYSAAVKDELSIGLYISVKFPKSTTTIDVADMVNKIVESSIGLEGSEPMPPFDKPITKVPAGFKKFIHD